MPAPGPYQSSDRNARLLSLFFVAILLLNFPLIGIFGKEAYVFGIPVLFAYLFVSWPVIIFFIQWTLRKKDK